MIVIKLRMGSHIINRKNKTDTTGGPEADKDSDEFGSGLRQKRGNMKYVQIKAIELNSVYSEQNEDSITLAVDETKTKVEEVPAVLRKIIKKKYNISAFGQKFNNDPIMFGREMDELDEKDLNEYGLYTIEIQKIKVNWDDGKTL